MAYTDLVNPVTRTDGKIGFYKGTAAGKVRVRRKGFTDYLEILGFASTPTTQFLVDGDSMSAVNSGMTQADTWSGHLTATLDGAVWGGLYNSAVGGQNIKSMIANAATEIDAKKSGAYVRHVVSCLMGINSIYHYAQEGKDAQTIFDLTKQDLIDYHRGRYFAGLLTVAFTLTATQNPAYTSLHARMEEARQLLNEWIRVNYQSVLYAAVLVDLDNSDLGGYSGVLNTTYYQTDKIHWTQEGRKRAAEVIRGMLAFLPATDPAGNAINQSSSYMTLANNDSSSLVKNGTWSTTSNTGLGLQSNDYISSADTGASITITTSTARLKYKTALFADGADFTVTIDGVNAGTGSCAGTGNSQFVWDSGDLAAGTHTFVFTKVGSDPAKKLYLDALSFGISAPLNVDNTHISWVKTGTTTNEVDTTKYRSVPTYTTLNTGTVFNEAGAKMTNVITAQRFRLFAPKFSGAGILNMKVTRLSDSEIVFNQNFDQSNATTVKAGGTSGLTAQLDTGLLTEAAYKVELTAVTANCSVDSVETETYPLLEVIENNAAGWVNESGTWNNVSGSTAYYRDGTGTVGATLNGKRSYTLPTGVREVQLFSPMFSGGGTITMNVIDTSNSSVVYTADFAQANATTVKSGSIAGTGYALSTLKILDAAKQYKVELVVKATSCSFDAIEIR